MAAVELMRYHHLPQREMKRGSTPSKLWEQQQKGLFVQLLDKREFLVISWFALSCRQDCLVYPMNEACVLLMGTDTPRNALSNLLHIQGDLESVSILI